MGSTAGLLIINRFKQPIRMRLNQKVHIMKSSTSYVVVDCLMRLMRIN